MPTPIRRITAAQFGLLAQPAQLTRKIAAVHVHHTWRPRRQDFRGLATVEAMRKFHMEQNGWSDLAQHLTIDPQGGLWTGRNWNLAPASATGHNGTAGEGPFMIEMVGDFDAGQDPFDGEQRTAAIETVAHLVRAFGLQDADVKFHNQLTNRALGARQDNPRPPRQRRGRSRCANDSNRCRSSVVRINATFGRPFRMLASLYGSTSGPRHLFHYEREHPSDLGFHDARTAGAGSAHGMPIPWWS
jgi:hypothetical protein